MIRFPMLACAALFSQWFASAVFSDTVCNLNLSGGGDDARLVMTANSITFTDATPDEQTFASLLYNGAGTFGQLEPPPATYIVFNLNQTGGSGNEDIEVNYPSFGWQIKSGILVKGDFSGTLAFRTAAPYPLSSGHLTNFSILFGRSGGSFDVPWQSEISDVHLVNDATVPAAWTPGTPNIRAVPATPAVAGVTALLAGCALAGTLRRRLNRQSQIAA